METENNKFCCTCKYMSTSCNEEPCRSCQGRSNWEINVKFKTGDIVIVKNNYEQTHDLYIYLRNKWLLYIPRYVIINCVCDHSLLSAREIDNLIGNDKVSCVWEDNIEYASPEMVEVHDDISICYRSRRPLNNWLHEIISEEPKKENLKILSGKTAYARGTKLTGTIKDQIVSVPSIKNVIFSDPATIIFWMDGTKTVVKTQDGEKYDKEKGFAMAVCKKVFGNERDYYHVFKRWMRKGKEV